MSKGLIFSGIQPTGNLHLGNYLGAVSNWVKMQNDYNCIFGVMDLHAITVPQNRDSLHASVREAAAALIACGIDPNRSIIMAQSSVSGHAELSWILGCHTPLGWLNRMTQFKEKAGKDKEKASLGLYGYPVLMAADVLLYKATHVPVGEDQKQHIELARDIAGAFNRCHGVDFFPLPEPVITGTATRVMSLKDGSKKMSKSDPSDFSRINLTDSRDVIFDKFTRATTDSINGVSYDETNRPHVSNLVNIFAALAEVSTDNICEKYASSSFSVFKKDLAELAVEKIGIITQKMNELLSEPEKIDDILAAGRDKAGLIAEDIIRDVKKLTGLPVF